MCALSCLQCTSGSAQQSGQWQHTAKKQLSLNWFDQLWSWKQEKNLCQSEQKTGWGVSTWLLLSSCCQQQRLRCPHQQKSAVDKWNDNTQWQVKWQEEVRHFEFLTLDTCFFRREALHTVYCSPTAHHKIVRVRTVLLSKSELMYQYCFCVTFHVICFIKHNPSNTIFWLEQLLSPWRVRGQLKGWYWTFSQCSNQQRYNRNPHHLR